MFEGFEWTTEMTAFFAGTFIGAMLFCVIGAIAGCICVGACDSRQTSSDSSSKEEHDILLDQPQYRVHTSDRQMIEELLQSSEQPLPILPEYISTFEESFKVFPTTPTESLRKQVLREIIRQLLTVRQKTVIHRTTTTTSTSDGGRDHDLWIACSYRSIVKGLCVELHNCSIEIPDSMKNFQKLYELFMEERHEQQSPHRHRHGDNGKSHEPFQDLVSSSDRQEFHYQFFRQEICILLKGFPEFQVYRQVGFYPVKGVFVVQVRTTDSIK